MKKRLSHILIYSIGLTPLLSIKLVGASIILFSLGALLKFSDKPACPFSKRNIFLALLISAPLLLRALFLTFSGAFFDNFKTVETGFPFLIFPVIFCFANPLRDKNEVHLLYKIFILSSALLSLICWARIACLAPQHNFTTGDWIREELDKIPVAGETPIYMSLLFSTGLLLLLSVKFKTRWIPYFIGGALSITLVLVGSRSALVALFVIGLIEFFKLSKNKFKIALIFAGFLALLFFTESLQKKRFSEFFTTQHIFPEGVHHNSFNLRMAIYKCSLETIRENFWRGTGVENTQTKLNECYRQFPTPAFSAVDYNTHNQYFDYLLTYGIFGFLLIFAAYFIVMRRTFVRSGSKEKYILLFFLIQFLFENILSRSTGVVTFVLFTSVFTFCAACDTSK